MQEELTSARPKVTLDREGFQQLLEAAYVIQQQSDRAHAKTQKGNSSRILSEISETQRLIQSSSLDVQRAAELIVARLQAVTGATWAAVGVVEGTALRYIGAYPRNTSPLNVVAIDDSASAECLRTGLIKRYAEVPLGHVAAKTLRPRGIESFIAVPFYSEGAVAGVLEAGFPEANGFDDQDVSACQLMAGLVTESVARAAEAEWKQVLAAERATMLETLERIKPQLERLVDPVEHEEPTESAALDPEELIHATQDTSAPILCRGCGNTIAEDEGYCGLCGLPSPAQKPTGDIQSKWASLWHMQQAQQSAAKIETKPIEDVDDSSIANDDLLALKNSADRELAAELGPDGDNLNPDDALTILPASSEPADAAPSPWTSATRAKQWLKSLESGARKKAWLSVIRRQRANIYLGAAILLLITVLAGWGSSSPKTNSTAPRLSLMDRTLIALNLAEAPPAPVHLGNPDTQVWVDVRTALYYCPGSEQYGKTAGGKMASQRDAQQDQFQPALRKACD